MSEEEEPKIACSLDRFEPIICRPTKTAVLFLGRETEDIDNLLNALDEIQSDLDMDIGVLDMNDDSCGDLSTKYNIDRDATQLVVFQDCEKKGAISLEGDYKESLAKLKEVTTPPPEGGGFSGSTPERSVRAPEYYGRH